MFVDHLMCSGGCPCEEEPFDEGQWDSLPTDTLKEFGR
jgi:hypothetical protein